MTCSVIAQLGGDLLVSSDGRVLLVHAGSNPLDRPDINTILALIKVHSFGILAFSPSQKEDRCSTHSGQTAGILCHITRYVPWE